MINEAQVLEVVKSVTSTSAYFFNGTLFLETVDSSIAVDVFNALYEQSDRALSFGKANESETFYDFS